MRRKIIVNIILYIFILLFIYTGGIKLWDFKTFSESVSQSPILKHFTGPVTWMTPCIEFIVVILLMGKKTRLIGLYAAFSLMMLFTGYIFLLHYFTDYIPCSCGGIFDKIPTDIHILLNLTLGALALIGIFFERKTNHAPVFNYEYKNLTLRNK